MVIVKGAAGAGGPTPPKPLKTRAKKLEDLADQANYVAGRAGQVGAGVANNEAGPAIGAAVEAASAGLSKLGPYGMAAGAALEAVAAVGIAASKTIDAFVSRGRDLAMYSGDLSGASAMADVRKMQADMREAQDMGPMLAQMIENHSKLEAVISETLRPIKMFLVDVLDAGMKTGLDLLVGYLEAMKVIIDKMTLGMVKTDGLEKMLARIHGIMAGGVEDTWDLWVREGEKVADRGVPPVPGGINLGVPLLMRGR